MDRGAVNFVSQIGVESTPGTSVAANRFLPTLSWMLKRDRGTKKFRARGSKVDTSHLLHKQMARGSAEGVLDYNSIIYVLDGLFNAATAAQIGGLTAYTREYTPGVRSADSTPKTYTVERGDAVACEDYAFTQLVNLNIEAGQDDFTIKADAISRAPADNQVLSGSITSIAERPVERNDIDVYIDDSFATIGTTKITQATEESLSLGEKFKEFFVHNSVTPEFADLVEIPYEPTFSFSTIHNIQSRTLIASLTSNPYKWVRWKAIGASLGTFTTERFETIQFDMCVKFDNPEVIDDEDGPLGYKYNCSMMPDMVGLLGFMKVTSINSLATL